jgi:hypothetical protein
MVPVGPVASAVLADVVLAAGDDATEDRCELHPLGGRRRDLHLRSPGKGAALDDLRAAWASLGLEMHELKTVVVDDPRHLAVSLGPVSNTRPATSTLR